MTEEPTETVTYLTVLFPVLLSVFLSVVFLWNTSVAQNTSSSCWSRGRDRSRATPDCFWSSQASPPNRTTPVWTSRAERRRSRMALEQISPPLWSEHWRETDLHSLPVPRRSATPNPVPSPPSTWFAERMPEPTADEEPESAATDVPSLHRATELACGMCHNEGREASVRSLASRAPSSVGSRSWGQPWKSGGFQMPTLPSTPASSTTVVWQPRCFPSARARWDFYPPALPWSEFPSTPPPSPGLRLGPLTRRFHSGS